MSEMLFGRNSWDTADLVVPNEAADIIDPLVETLFGQDYLCGIQMVNLGSMEFPEEPPTGPALVGFFHQIDLKSEKLVTITTAPAALIGAQLSRRTGLVTVDWHSVERLDPPTGPCSPEACGRLLYRGQGEVEVQQNNGQPIELEDPRLALTLLRVALVNLKDGNLAYDLHNQSLSDPELAVAIVEAGHRLTLPDAPQISRDLQLPYGTP